MKKIFLAAVISTVLITLSPAAFSQMSWRKALGNYIKNNLAKPDGGYGWPDQPDSHLTPTFAVTGILYTTGQLPQNKARLAEFIRTHHPQKGPNKEAGPSGSQLRDLTFQQLQAILWLRGDASSFKEEVSEWKSQKGILANYEQNNFAGLFQETMTPICRGLLGLPLSETKAEFIPYLQSCRRENGSFNNAPVSFGGDGNILNTYWSLYALSILDPGSTTLKAETIQWLQNCQLSGGGFTHQPDPKMAPNDEVVYTWAGVKALSLLGSRPKNVQQSINYLLSLRNSDGGFGNRRGMPSTPMATYYALDALKTLDNFVSLDKAPLPKKNAEKKTDFSGYKVYTVQFEASGSGSAGTGGGSPYEAVMLAKALKIHLWGVKNTQEGWADEAQRIADKEKVPVTFFISSEPYSAAITVPGMGTFNHVLDYITPAGKDVKFQKEAVLEEFNKTTVKDLQKVNGGLLMQVSNNEPLARILLDESLRTNSYLGISTIHFGQNFLFWLPYLYQYRYQFPFVTLQDAHSEAWWWSNELSNHRTLFIAKEPTYDAMVTALRNNWVAAVRHDSVSSYKTRMLGGTEDARSFIRSNEKDWKWWEGKEAVRPLGIITVLDKNDKFEEGRPDEGVNIRVRCWWNSVRQALKHPVAELIQLKLDGKIIKPELVKKEARRGGVSDSYYLYTAKDISRGEHRVEAVFKDLRTGRTEKISRDFKF